TPPPGAKQARHRGVARHAQRPARALLPSHSRRPQATRRSPAQLVGARRRCREGAEVRMTLFHKLDRNAELCDELSPDVEMRAAMNREAGLPEQRAVAEARRQFGNAAHIYEETRQVRINGFLESAAQDLRYAFRGFLRNPSFTLSAILALGLG